jgi:sterol desaturase/sphingolipid hydroxylase (fatty acid hydroxylase superfamily)
MILQLILLASGVLFWTFLEYIIHRFLGHQKKGKNVIRKEHQRHHAEVHYFAPMYKKLLLAIVVLAVTTVLVGVLMSFKDGFLFSIGFATMYFIYEVTHRRFHVKAPIIRYGLRMRKHHFYHHFGSPNNNHGVTTAFWDRIFGTYKKVDKVRVPKQMKMVWLNENKNNNKFQKHFDIR